MTASAIKSQLKVIIVGAGIGGLAAARALYLRGHEVFVFERAPTLGELGAGLQVGPSAVKVLYALGLKTELHAIACAPEHFATFNWLDGRLIHREPYQATFRSLRRSIFNGAPCGSPQIASRWSGRNSDQHRNAV